MAENSREKLAMVAVLLTIVASCALLVLPIYSNSHTLIQVNGLQTLLLLWLLVVISLMGLGDRRLRLFSGSLLLLFSLVSAIGIFYLPSSIMLLVAARRRI